MITTDKTHKHIICPRGYYSFDPISNTCEQCLSKAYCPGGSDIQLNKGTWRSSENSTIIYECTNEEACLGGNKSQCSEGYQGLFCSQCAGMIDKQTIYARSSGSQCGKCASFATQIGYIFVSITVTIVYVIYVLNNLLRNPQRNKPQTVLIRIFTNYFQVISLVKSFDLQWPSLLLETLKIFVSITNQHDNLFSIDCFSYQLGFIPTYYSKVIFMGVAPVVLSLISIPFWYASFKFSKKILKITLAQNATQATCSVTPDKRKQANSSLMNDFNAPANIDRESKENNEKMKQPLSDINERGKEQLRESSGELHANKKDFQKDIINSSLNPPEDLVLKQKDLSFNHSQILMNHSLPPQRFSSEDLRENPLISSKPPQSSNSASLEQTETSLEDQFRLFDKILTTCFILILLWHPSIINYSFSLFMCTDYEDGYTYLRKEISIRCWHGKDLYLQMSIGLVFIVLYAILFPVLIYHQIKKKQNDLDDDKTLKIYGIFYIGLTDKMFFWEIIIMNIRKIILVLIATFFSNKQQNFKGYVGILAPLFIQRHLSHYENPFIDPRFNDIEHWASLSSMFTIFGGLIFITNDTGKKNKSGLSEINFKENFNIIVFLLVILMNLIFLYKWANAFILVLYRIHFEKIKKACAFFKIELTTDVESYEIDLQKYKRKQKMFRQGSQIIDQISDLNDAQNDSQSVPDGPFSHNIDLQDESDYHRHNNLNRNVFNEYIDDSQIDFGESANYYNKPKRKDLTPLQLDNEWVRDQSNRLRNTKSEWRAQQPFRKNKKVKLSSMIQPNPKQSNSMIDAFNEEGDENPQSKSAKKRLLR